jgi:hypothetical protein
MKNGFEDIQPQVESSFRIFIHKLLRVDNEPLKYYYWTPNFFETNGGLSFNYFQFTIDQKDAINEIGKKYFEDSEVYFEVNKNSHRHDILIKNIHKLFPEGKKTGQSNRYEYLKEFILWEILESLSKTDKRFQGRTIEIQKNNFLITYLNYLFENTKKPTFDEFKDYKSFLQTNQYEELERKLKELDSRNVDNSKLRDKLSRLFVNRKEESKIHFVFSRSGGEEKEELRELLDVMGREETGKLYRGQANSTWKLDSSLTREKKYLDHESEMYYDILSLKPDAFINDRTVYERLITMQHFGMPTRLMDITRNPLVAIFFACNNLERAKSDGVVHTFSCDNKDFLHFEDEQLLKSLKKLFDKNNGNGEDDDFLNNIWFIKGVAKNQRISNQSGDFIFVGKGEKIKEQLHKLPALTIIIDAPTKKVLLEQLESLNIHGGAVYPDLTHMSNYIRNKFLFEKRSGKDFTIDIDLSAFQVEPKKSSSATSERKKLDPSDINKLTTDFDSEEFWTETRLEKLSQFSSSNSLDEELLKQMLEDLVAFDKTPIRSDVAKILSPKPKLSEYETIVQPIINQLVAFANDLKNP